MIETLAKVSPGIPEMSSVMGFQRRVLVLPLAAAMIAGLVAFKLTRPNPPSAAAFEERRAAPSFMALDSQNQLVKFERYLGRHNILLIFFDGEAGADRDPVLSRAKENFEVLQRRGWIVVGISAALPQQNRQAMARSGPFPFPLLSDPEFRVHSQWGCYDEVEELTRPGVFVVDRAGRVAWSQNAPRPQQPTDDFWKLLPEIR